jgi:hypothetical protein
MKKKFSLYYKIFIIIIITVVIKLCAIILFYQVFFGKVIGQMLINLLPNVKFAMLIKIIKKKPCP